MHACWCSVEALPNFSDEFGLEAACSEPLNKEVAAKEALG